jgi:hypothetical protein
MIPTVPLKFLETTSRVTTSGKAKASATDACGIARFQLKKFGFSFTSWLPGSGIIWVYVRSLPHAFKAVSVRPPVELPK